MKVFFSIAAIYLMAVFLIPHAYVFEKNNLQNYNSTEELAHQDNHHSPEAGDMCGPFCMCNCWGAVVVTVLHWSAINFCKPTPHYVSPIAPSYIGEIWQPPQINA